MEVTLIDNSEYVINLKQLTPLEYEQVKYNDDVKASCNLCKKEDAVCRLYNNPYCLQDAYAVLEQVGYPCCAVIGTKIDLFTKKRGVHTCGKPTKFKIYDKYFCKEHSRIENSLIKKNVTSTCSICLNTCNDEFGIELLCSHTYHLSCLYTWVEKSPNCPLCRNLITMHTGLIPAHCYKSKLRISITF